MGEGWGGAPKKAFPHKANIHKIYFNRVAVHFTESNRCDPLPLRAVIYLGGTPSSRRAPEPDKDDFLMVGINKSPGFTWTV